MHDWRKATYSIANGDCAEVAAANGVVGVRDTKQEGVPDRTELMYSSGAWDRFLREVKGGVHGRGPELRA